MISEANLEILKKEGLLDNENHPTVEAYVKAINTVSADNSPLCQQLWEHVNNCTICSKRAETALERTKR